MTIRQRGEVWHYTFKAGGRTYSGSTGQKSRREAEAIARRIRTAVREGWSAQEVRRQFDRPVAQRLIRQVGGVALQATGAARVCDIPGRILESPGAVGMSGESMAFILRPWEDLVGYLHRTGRDRIRVSQFGDEIGAEYVRHLEREGSGLSGLMLSPATRNRYIDGLRRGWRLATGATTTPWDAIARLRARRTSHEAFSPGEIDTILEHARGDIRHVVMVGLYTGLRLGDICELRVGEVDLEAGWIRRRANKTGRDLQIPILAPLENYLRREVLPGDDDAVAPPQEFLHPALARRYRTHPPLIGRGFTRFLEDECGITSVLRRPGYRATKLRGVHSLRHTFAYLAALAGVPLPIVQSVLGHSAATMTTTYMDHATAGAKQTALQALVDAIAPVGHPAPIPIEAQACSGLSSDHRALIDRIRELTPEQCRAVLALMPRGK